MLNAEQISCQESLESMDSRRYGLKGDNGFFVLTLCAGCKFFLLYTTFKNGNRKKIYLSGMTT